MGARIVKVEMSKLNPFPSISFLSMMLISLSFLRDPLILKVYISYSNVIFSILSTPYSSSLLGRS